MNDVRWFVMGDDDTLFFPDNLVRVLSKYDHDQYYYIGSTSESHQQNIVYNYGMAYGGGGFAISYPLAKALANLQDRCIERYPGLYGSDDRIHACMSELGVPLTRERGFHQNDFYGNIFGIVAAHPITPLVSLHRYSVTNAIFPRMDKLEALEKAYSSGQTRLCCTPATIHLLRRSPKLDYIGIMGLCSSNNSGHASSTRNRNGSKDILQLKPFLHFFSDVSYNSSTDQTLSEYIRQDYPYPRCEWKMADPLQIARVEAPRRNCCRILPTERIDTLVVDVGECREDEFIEDNLKTYQEQTSFVFEMCFHPDAGGGYDCLVVCLPVYSMSMATLPPVHDEVDLVSSNDSILSDKSGGL
ncbi:F22L4.11 PROTEIN [Salix purpurea]|uniref:F22L4.11 PROTEIN n=1 Tax=Salix purpurea TaxID=77065 RepID=A0A9Q0VGM9_SALPP|nr:F22L4.11 PROTEIN [Salix purpurea]